MNFLKPEDFKAEGGLEESVSPLQKLGFNVKKNTLRTDSLCMLKISSYNIDVAIQLIAKGSEFEDFSQFRDLMNQNPNLVNEYNQLKIDSADISPDQYREKKSVFIKKVLRTHE